MKTQIAIITRADYMENRATHHDYYLAIAKRAGIGNFNPVFMKRVVDALAAGDEHLNTIPLKEWDCMASFDLRNPHLGTALKERGDNYSLSTGVCLRKESAKEQALPAFKLRMDKNGNKTLYPCKIQTNGNMPRTHRDGLGEWTFTEIAKYLGK